MKNKLYEKGDRIHRGSPVVVDRYTRGARINHWIAAGSMILLALTGLIMYWPFLFPLANLFGGGQVVRMIHPYIGIVMLLSFFGLFFRFWRLNIWEKSDLQWAMQMKDVLEGNEEKLPPVGKYNFGQKCIFWAMSFGLIILIVSGLMVWQAYFAPFVPIEWQRYALIIHSLVAAGIIAIWVMHMYAVYWIRGSLRAMVKGKVSGGFAWAHHRKWYDSMLKNREIKDLKK
ncbi:formate dehydrogenase subunit gamma [Bartonella tamiae]|uniref:Formate dehydrogenase, gamma subunit n=1 Tax=Bartonella tamiae Th239 TaxID=1094558 RepID=J1K2J9_9HYPH|nr:formate dehydrogenase subunit gamma [Bartonella tamiae]EJF91712.1 formate dehydrogenase, gamma subunit [Bartonella tamiae Th239]EJF92621.1 formate dehydrogenase, gamma subunit [Bartonella tamiae Th307]